MTWQIEADRRLLAFGTYEDYLDSLVIEVDMENLPDIIAARKVAELGYRSYGDTLTREQFHKRVAIVKDYFFPIRLPTDTISKGIHINDSCMQSLASRELGNRLGVLATIIFLRIFTKKGFEISAYIDYADRLDKQNWEPYFLEKKKLWPKPDDLSFYHWRNNSIHTNDSRNFKAIIDPIKGLVFRCHHDRKSVVPNPGVKNHGPYTTRISVSTDKYDQFIIYDHIIRRRS